jgi:ribosomal-protein-serine acetyltransferase
MGRTDGGLSFRLSDDCRLRLLEEADAEELHRLVEANRAYLGEWMPWAAEQTAERTLAFIRTTERRHDDNNGFEMAIVFKGRLVGAAGLAGVDWVARSTSIGYWLDERHQGRGLMTRAVRALIDHAFGEMGLHRVEIRAAAENRRSRAIPERLGFEQEGLLREAEHVGDRYQDLVVYGLLAGERRRLAGERQR